MRKFILTLVGSLTLLSACNVLDQESEVLILNENAITDAASAESALNGLYDALQSGSLYGGRWAMASELLANNARAA
ncbi:MAG TPA: RagB/SusD family nutrient uptake outer membrane protein, partial [Cytophagales bacterium]|nr:RagB/SusD family nutrient uptake outer membrane protein [Cytophagales bacterium]